MQQSNESLIQGDTQSDDSSAEFQASFKALHIVGEVEALQKAIQKDVEDAAFHLAVLGDYFHKQQLVNAELHSSALVLRHEMDHMIAWGFHPMGNSLHDYLYYKHCTGPVCRNFNSWWYSDSQSSIGEGPPQSASSCSKP